MSVQDEAERFEPSTVEEWAEWLAAHHATTRGVWLVTPRSSTGRRTVDYESAIVEALRFGWVDSTAKTLDEERGMLWFSPRRPTSGWAGTNKVRIERLRAEGRLEPAGEEAVRVAMENGSWSLLDDVERLVVPDDLAAALAVSPGAREGWERLAPSARRMMLTRIVQAKRPETRARRVAEVAQAAAPTGRGTATVTPAELVELTRVRLAEAADPERAPAMQAYMKSEMPYRGIGSQQLRQLCRGLFDTHVLSDEASWRSAVLDLWDGAAFREERYAAFQLTGHRHYREHQRVATLDLYRHLVVSGAWWDHVDGIASNRVGPILRAHLTEVTPSIRAWAVDGHMWVRRTAILCQLMSKQATDVDLLRFVLEENLADSPYGDEFFIRKAVGWALRQHARVDPAWVLEFLDEHDPRLSGLSRREALKHLG